MKKSVSLLLSAALLLGLLAGCRQAPAAGTQTPAAFEEPGALDVVNAVFPRCGYDEGSGDVEYLTGDKDGKEFLAAYLDNAYDLQDPWEDAAVIRGMGASAFELAVLRMEDDGAAVRAATSLMNYISVRQGDFTGYAPDQADMVAHGSINQQGPYAALFICPDTGRAEAAFSAAVKGEALPLPGEDSPAVFVTDVKELRDLLVSSQGMNGTELEKLDDGDLEALKDYVEDAYGLTPELWDACAIAWDEGSAFEVAVIRVPYDWDLIWQVEEKLTDYLDGREAGFDASTDQGRLLHRALVAQTQTADGTSYIVLLACKDQEEAMSAFSDATGGTGFGYSPRYRYLDTDPDYPNRCLFTQPNQDDMSLYDTSAIRAAWENSDPSGLSKEDRKIYDKAKSVLRKVLKDGMSDLEKETAIYSWIVNNVNYDWTHQDRMKETPRASFTPYGGLVNRKAVCLGYATTFQLLCDLAGVKCSTVVGAAHSSTSDHAWNMVQLNETWYCVDVTWDANYREQGASSGRQEGWDYFNVTSEQMADTDHQWDYANTPEAVTEGNGRG